ncbi:CAP domain-containing protein [Angustibacter aerolatus]
MPPKAVRRPPEERAAPARAAAPVAPVARVAAASTTARPTARAATPRSRSWSDAAELRDVVRLTNHERANAGAPPVQLDARLTRAAQRHSDDMATRRRMGHDGSDGTQVGDRTSDAGYPAGRVSENVAVGQTGAAEVVRGWLHSRGHRRNLLDPAVDRIGVAVTVGAGRPYWTQVFGG